MHPFVVGSGTLQHHNIDGIIHILATAGGFAGVRTDTATDSRHRHIFADSGQSLAILVIFYFFDILGNIYMGRTLVHTGSGDFVDIAVCLWRPVATQTGNELFTVMCYRIKNWHRSTLTKCALAVFK